ncbi:hypothetical protein EDB80DRAFT_596131 [Ilyonectria destructans]|nr:hypothetical protein EDB80DRAFT_596131 [Ilyonectria destructans]
MELIFDNTLAYGIGLAGLFLLMALLPHIHIALKYTCPLILKIGRVPPLPRVANLFSSWVLKHLVYPHRADAVLFITYLAANLTCIFVDLPTVEKAGARAGTLALINMLPLYIGPCLSFIADALHISLSAHRRIHAWAGHIVLLLTLFHGIVAAISQGNFSLEEIRNIWPFTALVSVGLLALPIWLFTKVFPYEFLLISHHFISILVTYFIWHHLPSESLFPRLYLYITLGVFLSSFILQTSITLYRSHFRFSLTRVSAEYCREIPHDDRETREIRVLTVTLYLRKPLKVEPGQYINLWTLSTPLSVFQIHPFTVTSSDKSQTKLELVIKPRQGLTRKLADLLEYGDLEYGDTTIITLFTGPHGRALPVDKVDNVLLVATGLGIIALLLYLERLIDDGRTRESCTRRVHLVWQVEDLGKIATIPAVHGLISPRCSVSC